MFTPPQLPDLNPIEHILAELSNRIKKYHITDEKSLKIHLQKGWNKITPDITNTLILSMPRRIQAVIDAKEWSTRY